jgi:hypothetical protein
MLAPPEVVVKIMEYLSVKDILVFGSSCSYLWSIQQDPILWRKMLRRYDQEGSCKEDFVVFFKRYFKWFSIFGRMKAIIRYHRLI